MSIDECTCGHKKKPTVEEFVPPFYYVPLRVIVFLCSFSFLLWKLPDRPNHDITTLVCMFISFLVDLDGWLSIFAITEFCTLPRFLLLEIETRERNQLRTRVMKALVLLIFVLLFSTFPSVFPANTHYLNLFVEYSLVRIAKEEQKLIEWNREMHDSIYSKLLAENERNSKLERERLAIMQWQRGRGCATAEGTSLCPDNRTKTIRYYGAKHDRKNLLL